MKPSAPKIITWWVSVIIVVIAVLGYTKTIPGIRPDMAFWLAVIGFAILAIANLVKGL
jgi:ABC-type multidrug transport system permease subunit